MLGDPSAAPLWERKGWTSFYEAFDPVVMLCRDKPLLRASVWTNEAKPKGIRFGRLVWSVPSFQKWVRGNPGEAGGGNDGNFFFVEISAPSLPEAGRQGRPPDFFAVIHNEAFLARGGPVAFNPRVFVAIAADMPEDALSSCRKGVATIASLVASKLSTTIKRPWGYAFGSSGAFQNSIQDLPHTGLFKVGPPHARPIGLSTLRETWHEIR